MAVVASEWVWVLSAALCDSPNDPMSEIIGVFSTKEAAEEAGRAEVPHTALVQPFKLDVLDPVDEPV